MYLSSNSFVHYYNIRNHRYITKLQFAREGMFSVRLYTETRDMARSILINYYKGMV